MIYLTKSFTCVIVSRWCDQVRFQSVFEDVKAWRIASALEVHSNRGQQRLKDV